MQYVKVILPLLLEPLTYSLESDDVAVGSSVMVELGKRKLYEGIVCEITCDKPSFKTKPILKVISTQPLIGEKQIKFWQWIASYYMSTLGEVMRVAMPGSLKNSAFSESDFLKTQFKESKIKMLSLVKMPEKATKSDKQNFILERLGVCESLPCSEFESVAVRALEKKGCVRISLQSKEISAKEDFELPVLSKEQTVALDKVENDFKTRDVVLLRGITGSGKTEIYINLIAEKLSKGEDVLYLVPEIALTTQLISRLEKVFEDRVSAYHSKFSQNQRAELFSRVARGGGQLILGVRSSIFLPFAKLGLVIIDEEHDSSFKQFDSAPNYNARDAVVVLASLYGCKTLMGSATPSLESFLNAKAGKYGYVELLERYAGASVPDIIISDNTRAVKRGERKGHFNKLMLDKIELALENKNQVILFQNRRGFSPFVECEVCGYVPGCPNCNVSLTLHKAEGALKCHYCGYRIPEPKICPKCSSAQIKNMGFGTEKIEQDLQELLPLARIARLDADTASSRKSFERIISDFEKKQTDIIVGTQMITKGFDFESVTLVGILNADNMMNQPDFRASERAFQLMSQVSGRAGRGEKKGEVVIQTSQQDSPVLANVISHDYLSMVESEASLRECFSYPPFCRLIQIEIRSKNKNVLNNATIFLNKAMRGVFANRVLGPQAPAVDKIKEYYLMGFLLKIEREASFARAKDLLREIIAELHSRDEFKYVELRCNVDP